MEQTVKVRKIGNSYGVILPRETGVKAGDILTFAQNGTQMVLDKAESAKAHDRILIEAAFSDFKEGNMLNEAEMKDRFGKYGWQ